VLGASHPLQRLLLGKANEIALRRLQLRVDATLLHLEPGVAIDELDAGVFGEALRRQLLGRDEMRPGGADRAIRAPAAMSPDCGAELLIALDDLHQLQHTAPDFRQIIRAAP